LGRAKSANPLQRPVAGFFRRPGGPGTLPPMKGGLIPVLAAASLAATGCAAGRDAHDRAMHGDLESVQAESDRRGQRLAEGLPEEPRGEAPAPRQGGPTHRDVIRIGSRDGDSPRVDDPGPRPVLKVTGGRRGGSVETANLEEPGAAPEAITDEERALLKRADEALRAGRHKEALDAFGRVLVAHPGGPLAEQAILGRAAAFQAAGDRARAAEELEALLSRFPGSEAKPEVLARLVNLHRALGHRERAAELADRLRSEHPKSDAAKRVAREDPR
jgi:TolA-binding protein